MSNVQHVRFPAPCREARSVGIILTSSPRTPKAVLFSMALAIARGSLTHLCTQNVFLSGHASPTYFWGFTSNPIPAPILRQGHPLPQPWRPHPPSQIGFLLHRNILGFSERTTQLRLLVERVNLKFPCATLSERPRFLAKKEWLGITLLGAFSRAQQIVGCWWVGMFGRLVSDVVCWLERAYSNICIKAWGRVALFWSLWKQKLDHWTLKNIIIGYKVDENKIIHISALSFHNNFIPSFPPGAFK